MKAAGLSIEDSSIKAVIYSGKTVIKDDESVDLPSSISERAAAFKDALAGWKNRYGIEGVRAGIDFKHFSHNFVELPLTSIKDIKNALPVELAKHLPLAPEEYVNDFFVIERRGKTSKCLVLSVRQEKLDWITEGVKEAGLKLLGIKCSAIEALNEFQTSGMSRNALFLHASGGAYHLVGLKESSPVFIGSFTDEEEAGSQIAKLIESYDRGIYSSGPAPFPEARSLHYSMPRLIAFPHGGKNKIDLDFTPPEFLPQKTDYYPRAIGILTATALILFFLTSLIGYYKDCSALEKLKAKNEEIKASAGGLVEIRKNFEEVEKKKGFLLDFRNGGNRNISALRELSLVLPEGAWLTNFSADENGKIKIEGYAARTADIIAPIEKSRLFKNVEFIAPVTVKEGRERFALKMETETTR